jgi:hypothetical protein
MTSTLAASRHTTRASESAAPHLKMDFARQAAHVAEATARGYLSAEEVVAWTDACIAAMDAPPFWLLDVSTSVTSKASELAMRIRPHITPLSLPDKARVAAAAFLSGRLSYPEVFRALGDLWVEGMHDSGESSELPEALLDLLVEHDQLIDDDRLPSDFHLRFERATRDLISDGGPFPF